MPVIHVELEGKNDVADVARLTNSHGIKTPVVQLFVHYLDTVCATNQYPKILRCIYMMNKKKDSFLKYRFKYMRSLYNLHIQKHLLVNNWSGPGGPRVIRLEGEIQPIVDCPSQA